MGRLEAQNEGMLGLGAGGQQAGWWVDHAQEGLVLGLQNLGQILTSFLRS